MIYRRDIDGLRAIAVSLVLFYHAELGWSGGYIGVDVFFVISGYLLTGIIATQARAGNFSFIDFFCRRIRRLYPAMLVMMASILLFGYFWLAPQDLIDLGLASIGQAAISSNIYFWKAVKAGYFAESPTLRPTLHTWSLAVEEQFYLFLPILIGICISLDRNKKLLFILCGLLGAISFAISARALGSDANFAFFMLPSRAWELLLGCLANLLPQKPTSGYLRETMAFTGLCMVLSCGWYYQPDTAFPGLAALPPCIGTALLLISSEHSLTRVGKGLSARPVVAVGLVSYSLYLWHWPILAYLKYLLCRNLTASEGGVALIVSLLVATCSYFLVEKTARDGKLLRSRGRTLFFAALGTTLLGLTGLAYVRLKGMPGRWNPARLGDLAAKSDSAFLHESTVAECNSGGFPVIGAQKAPIRFLLWGDSHAMALVPGLDELAKAHQVAGLQATHSATPPAYQIANHLNQGFFGKDWLLFQRGVHQAIRREKVQRVGLAANWQTYDDPEFRDALVRSIADLLNLGCEIYLIKDVPTFSLDVPRALMLGFSPEKYGPTPLGHAQSQAFLEEIARGNPQRIHVLDPAALLVESSGNSFMVRESSEPPFYRDASHLTKTGSRRVCPALLPLLH